MKCKNCKAHIDNGAGFCPNCGLLVNKKKSVKKRVLITVLSIFALLIVSAAVLLIRFFLMPQVRVATAFANTLSTAGESGINQKYGGYDLAYSMMKGNFDVELISDDEDRYVNGSIRRNKDENKFYTYVSYENKKKDTSKKELSLYADADTSIIGCEGIGRKPYNMEIDYNSAFFVGKKAKSYKQLMQALTGTAEEEENSFSNLYKETIDLVLNLESERCGKKYFNIGGKEIKCKVYRIAFNANDIATYVQDCYNISADTGKEADKLIEKLTGHDMEELFEIINDKTKSMEDLDVYFAVNSKNQLVSLYCKDVSDKKINFEINFYGSDYLCANMEIKYSDKTGREISIVKEDISSDNRLEIRYSCTYIKKAGSPEINSVLSYAFESGRFYCNYGRKDNIKGFEAAITGYNKGEYIELKSDNNYVYIGAKVRDIIKPDR